MVSLAEQREVAEAFIAAQKPEGWLCLPDRYDDHAVPGDSLDRPALQRLITDLDQAVIDVVVVAYVSRLATTLPAFTQLMNRFQAHDVTFACVRPPLITRDSVSRLMLHVLLSLNQFEHELDGFKT